MPTLPETEVLKSLLSDEIGLDTDVQPGTESVHPSEGSATVQRNNGEDARQEQHHSENPIAGERSTDSAMIPIAGETCRSTSTMDEVATGPGSVREISTDWSSPHARPIPGLTPVSALISATSISTSEIG